MPLPLHNISIPSSFIRIAYCVYTHLACSESINPHPTGHFVCPLSPTIIFRIVTMQQTSDTPSSDISRIPDEILWMILLHTMRSDVPVHLEHLLRLGRRFHNIRHGNDTQNPGTHPCKVDNTFSESGVSACSNSWFLGQLDPGQVEHFRDWLLINSTCRRFRAWGKKAFFSEKTFILRPPFLKTLCEETAKTISAEDVKTARSCIRHVIVPLPHPGTSEYITLPRYHVLQRLRSMCIYTSCNDDEIFFRSKVPPRKRYPFPEELSTLLQDLGLQVNRLQMEMNHRNDFQEPLDPLNDERYRFELETLDNRVYPLLRILLALKRKRGSEEIESDLCLVETGVN